MLRCLEERDLSRLVLPAGRWLSKELQSTAQRARLLRGFETGKRGRNGEVSLHSSPAVPPDSRGQNKQIPYHETGVSEGIPVVFGAARMVVPLANLYRLFPAHFPRISD